MRRCTIALALAVLALAACEHKPQPGDECTSMMLVGGCSSDHSALYCENNRYVEVPCRGSAGCSVADTSEYIGAMTCDVSQNLDGDRCARPTGSPGIPILIGGQEGIGACTPDHRMLVGCTSGAFHRQLCDGPTQCTETGGNLACDTRAAAP